MAIIGFKALDDHLALALDRIDEQRVAALAFGLDEDDDAVERIGGLGAKPSAADVDQGTNLSRMASTRAAPPMACTSPALGRRVSTMAVSGTTSV